MLPCAVHANLLVRNFGRARVEFSTASSAVVMGEVGCVPLGRWQRTRRIAHASDECAIEERARIVLRICNVFDHGKVEMEADHTCVMLSCCGLCSPIGAQRDCYSLPTLSRYAPRVYTPLTARRYARPALVFYVLSQS